MTPCFEAICQPTEADIAAVEMLNPHSPFNTAAYAASCMAYGMVPCVFALKAGSDFISGCLGYLQEGSLSRRLEIISAPKLTHSITFWNGIFDFCRNNGVWDLDIETYASDVLDIPSMPGEISRRKRWEYVLDLDTPNLVAGFSRNHRRNIKLAKESGLYLQRTRTPEACQEHLRLIKASMDRRMARGEKVSFPETSEFFEVLLRSGVGEIFQVFHVERAISSVLVVRSAYTAYNQTSGTAPVGMQHGASKFLIAEVAAIMKKEGVRIYNLGGVDAHESSLQQFKAGFGGQVVFSEEASFSMVSPIKEKFRTAARLMRRTSLDLLSALSPKTKKEF